MEKAGSVEKAITDVKVVGPDDGKDGFLGSIGVLEGRMGALLGDDVVEAAPGDLVFKPRNQWHTFWNAGDELCRILEMISPAGFERFFHELSDMGGVANVDEDAFAQLTQRYGIEMRPETVPKLLERFGLRMGEPIPGGWRP